MEAYRTVKHRGFTINWYYDDDPSMNPRDWDCNLSHMICWHRNYNIGDKHEFSNPDNLFAYLVNAYCSDEELREFVVQHKGDCYAEFEEYEGDVNDLDYLGIATLYDGSGVEMFNESWECDSLDKFLDEIDLTEHLSRNDMEKLLEPHLVIHTISIHDHSGVTVWIGSANDKWDSATVGYIYQTKEDTIKNICGAIEENWVDEAWENMESEMKVYDQYIRGEVFGFQIEDEDGDDVDSCWGYYGDTGIEDQMPECFDIIDKYIERRAIQSEIDWEENTIKNCLDFSFV